MNNKYDMWLTKEEQEKLLNNMKAIMDYATDLVKDFDGSVELEANWTFYDTIWGNHKCKFVINKRNKGVNVEGQTGGLGIYFHRDFFGEGKYESYSPFSTKTYSEYGLSLIENWPSVKTQINDQLERAKSLKAMTSGFKV